MKFNHDYVKEVRLSAEERVRVRLLRATDKQRLREGFDALSAASRQKRFFGGKHALSDGELRYLTEVDQVDHVAIGAVMLDAAGDEGAGAGVARFVRLPAETTVAEVALTVIDRMQGRGIGRLLLRLLVEAAVERGIERFRFECLAHNQEMHRLVQTTCDVVGYVNDDDVIVAEVALPDRDRASPDLSHEAFERLYALLRGFAVQAIALQMHTGIDTVRRTLDLALGSGQRTHTAAPDRESRGPADQ
ncbi:MAG: GNAT family N-acetyltransferase [Gammaproteobacteria bacterium]|nr:GNAT family N-acetyltransferase [Gammaproteobacteria bacterium]